MTGQADRIGVALTPVQAALLSAAEADARAIASDSDHQSRALLASARDRRQAVLEEARAQGEAEGAARVDVERARVQREARGVVLAAQRAAYDELRRQARAALRELLEDPAERGRLAAAVRSRLGDGVVLSEHRRGGLVGETGDGRVVDASVDSLVEEALAGLDVQTLWAPA